MVIPQKYPPLSGKYHGYSLTCSNCGWNDIYIIDSIADYVTNTLKSILHISETCPQCGAKIDKQKTVFIS